MLLRKYGLYFKFSDIRLRDGYKRMEMKERSSKRLGLRAKYFGFICAIVIATIILVVDIPLLDRLLAISLLIPVFFSPERAPAEGLPSAQSSSQLIWWGLKRAFRGIWWDVIFLLALYSLVYVLGYEESLALRPSLIIVNSYFLLKFLYSLHRERKGA